MNLVLVGRAMGSVPYRSRMLLTTTVSFVSKKEKLLSIKVFAVYDLYCCSLIDICQDPSGIFQKISTLRTSSVKFESWSVGAKHCGQPIYHPMSLVPPYRFAVEDDRDNVDSSSDGWKASECCCLLSGKRATVANCPICFSFVSYHLVRL